MTMRESTVGRLLAGLGGITAACLPGFAQCDVQRIRPDEGAALDLYSGAVAVDAETVVIGAPHAGLFGDDAGVAYVFRRTPHGLVEEAILVGFDTSADHEFGWSVAVSGRLIVVGAPGADDAGPNTGAAYIFRHTAMGWVQEAKLLSDSPETADAFGRSVAATAGLVLVGAPHSSSVGTAHLFEGGQQGWHQVHRFLGSDAGRSDRVGSSVAICRDTVIVGASGFNTMTTGYGVAYVYEKQGDSWQEFKVFSHLGYEFGSSVDIVPGCAIVGAAASSNAFVYRRLENVWHLEETLDPPAADGTDRCGNSVAIGREWALIGCPLFDVPQSNSGMSALYSEVDGDWIHVDDLQPPNVGSGWNAGHGLGMDGDYAVIGAPVGNGPVPDSGVAHAYALNGGNVSRYCRSEPNSAGSGARIYSSGHPSISDGGFGLTALGCPGSVLGLFCYGPERDHEPFGGGYLCVGPGESGVFRLWPPIQTGDGGDAWLEVDFDSPPAGAGAGRIHPGSTWHFQFWYRDPGFGGSGFNLTDGVGVTFCR